MAVLLCRIGEVFKEEMAFELGLNSMSGSLPCRERREGHSRKRNSIWENTKFERVAYSENGEKFLVAEA